MKDSMKWTGHGHNGGEEKVYRAIWRKDTIRRLHRWETIIKIYRKEIGWEGLGLSVPWNHFH